MIDNLIEELKPFMVNQTNRSWTKNDNPFNFENEYIKVFRIASSNKWTGNKESGFMSKMWSIIIDIKKNFENLNNFQLLKTFLNITITPVTKGKFKGYYGIRIYDMRQEPNNHIIHSILNYIFNK